MVDFTDKFFEIPTGSYILSDIDYSIYIKPEQTSYHHMQGMVVSLESGKIVHFSHIITDKFLYKNVGENIISDDEWKIF